MYSSTHASAVVQPWWWFNGEGWWYFGTALKGLSHADRPDLWGDRLGSTTTKVEATGAIGATQDGSRADWCNGVGKRRPDESQASRCNDAANAGGDRHYSSGFYRDQRSKPFQLNQGQCCTHETIR